MRNTIIAIAVAMVVAFFPQFAVAGDNQSAEGVAVAYHIGDTEKERVIETLKSEREFYLSRVQEKIREFGSLYAMDRNDLIEALEPEFGVLTESQLRVLFRDFGESILDDFAHAYDLAQEIAETRKRDVSEFVVPGMENAVRGWKENR